jgi:hypothetical protein
MRRRSLPFLALLFGLMAAPSASAQQPTLNEIMQRVRQSEATLLTNLRNFKPMVEVYIQNLKRDPELGMVPIDDSYVLGRFDWRKGSRLQPFSGGKKSPRFQGATRNKDLEYVPDGFAAMAAPDWEPLTEANYDFTLVRREFVGEVRCWVVDVIPVKNLKDGFAGRIWIEATTSSGSTASTAGSRRSFSRRRSHSTSTAGV